MSDMSRRGATGAKADRDRTLEQALTHQLRGGTSATPECLDAETLAAWQDEALDAAQMSTVELHLSNCSRCQAMLAAFVRGSAMALPETAPEAEGFRWWRWWLAPIAAGAFVSARIDFYT